MSSDKLKNWKQSIDIDYLSLYIKTWFAFLSSLKQIYPHVISAVGDGELVNHYIDNMVLPSNFDNEIKSHVKKAFKHGKIVIGRDLPESYFGRFFYINRQYHYSIPNDTGHARFKIEFRTHAGRVKNPNLLIEFRSTQVQFHDKFKVHYFSLNIPISEFISANIYENMELCIRFIIERMRNHVYEFIAGIPQLQESGRNLRKAYIDTILTYISHSWRPNFRIDQLFQPMPVLGFPDDYDESLHKIVVIKWFIRFNYNLRNILFHHIIDPFDDEWLKLFRHTYLALKEVVNHNIGTINQRADSSGRTDNV